MNFLIYQLNSLINVLEILFSRLLEISSVIPVFTNVGERSTAKNYCPVSLLSVISKVLENLVNNRIVDHLET